MTGPQFHLPRLFSQYLKLCSFCDNLFARSAAGIPGVITCHTGCCDCCELESVNALEASVLSMAARRIVVERPGSFSSTADRCVLLKNGRCLLYPRRPIICRTHGLAFKRRKENTCSIHHCPRNFQACSVEELLTSPQVIDEETISANLARLNIAFCRIIGLPQQAAERFEIAAILMNDLPPKVAAAEFGTEEESMKRFRSRPSPPTF